MQNTVQSASQQTGFQLKASSLTFTVIQPTTISLDIIDAQLQSMAEKTPNFFNATPILIDLTLIEKLQTVMDLPQLVKILKAQRMLPIGVKTSNDAYRVTANSIGLASLNYSSANTTTSQAKPKTAEAEGNTENKASKKNNQTPEKLEQAATTFTNTLVIDQTVRSGKQIYAKNSDLIINASVSHGAEVLADGNIHIYGTLNGRALAGVQGDVNARVYCKSLNAELVAIAGNYLVNEQIPELYKNAGSFLLISLEQQNLVFTEI